MSNRKSIKKNVGKSAAKTTTVKATVKGIVNVRKAVAKRSVASDVDFAVIDGVVRLVASGGTWNGSMAELETALRRRIRRSVTGWPSSPRGMRASLDRVVNRLRRLGVKARFSRTPDHARKRVVEFTR